MYRVLMIFYIQKSVRFCPRLSMDIGNDFFYRGLSISEPYLGLYFQQGFVYLLPIIQLVLVSSYLMYLFRYGELYSFSFHFNCVLIVFYCNPPSLIYPRLSNKSEISSNQDLDKMRSPLILAIITASGILLSYAILPFQTNGVYAEESETDTEGGLTQENIGSGESINTNCGENTIDSSTSVINCGVPPTGLPPLGAFPVTIQERRRFT